MSSHDLLSKQEIIKKILENTRTIAVVGFSAKQSRASHYVPAYLQDHGYRIIPVNPSLQEGLGEPAYPDLKSIPQPVDLVLLFRRSEDIPPLVDQAIEIGAKAVWMQQGIANPAAAQAAQQAGLDVVMDACMMVEHRQRMAFRP